MKQYVVPLVAAVITVGLLGSGCGAPAATEDTTPAARTFQLDADSNGMLEEIDNIVNTTVVSNDPNVFKAEYEAGFIQGRLQRDSIPAARDNGWDGDYLVDPSHTFPKQLPPSQAELRLAARALRANWDYTMDYIRGSRGDVKRNLRRLMYRMVGIYDGATNDTVQARRFDDTWYPSFSAAELQATYGTPGLTFIDVYYVNTTGDLPDILPADENQLTGPSRCTAFVRVTQDDIYLTHNTWAAFLSQTQALNLWVNGDFMSINTIAPGNLGSGTDFGYTNKGLIFNETTEHATRSRSKVRSLWTSWRSTLAEQYSASIGEFFSNISLEQSGSYMNGYMIVDAKRDELGYVEMSSDTTVFFRPREDRVAVSTKPAGLDTSFDRRMVTPDYILGFNYPASHLIQRQIKAENTRPARRVQLLAGIDDISDLESAKNLITYTATDNPLSIYGRWDLGYGVTTTPKTVPDGSIDAKAVSASMAQRSLGLDGALDPEAGQDAFWMKFGTPIVDGKPFVWSESQWKDQPLRDVPDALDGSWQLLSTNIR